MKKKKLLIIILVLVVSIFGGILGYIGVVNKKMNYEKPNNLPKEDIEEKKDSTVDNKTSEEKKDNEGQENNSKDNVEGFNSETESVEIGSMENNENTGAIENPIQQPTIDNPAPSISAPSQNVSQETPSENIVPITPPIQEPVVVQPETPTCVSKKFVWSWFRPDFDSLEECQEVGNQYIKNYGYSCSNVDDDCGVTYYMLELFDRNGEYYDYRETPKDSNNN